MIRPDIQALCAEWIGADGLRIQDRIISASYVPNLATDSGAALYGLLRIDNLDEGRFSVSIQDPETWPVGGSRELSQRSIEEALVHELVHIRWIDLTADKQDATSLVQEERATWATAQALVAAKYDKRAAEVRAMVARLDARTMVSRAEAARGGNTPRRAITGRRKMIDAATAKSILDALQGDDIEAMKAALRGIVESALTGGDSGPPSAPDAPPMPADAGNGTVPDDKNKPPMQMAPDKMARAMKAATDEAAAAIALLRPAAKNELVRGMRADGVPLTPHAEKLILEAPTVQDAERLAAGMRAMAPSAPAGQRPPANPPTDTAALAGLTRSQRAKYDDISKSNPKRAEAYRAESLKANAEAAARKGN